MTKGLYRRTTILAVLLLTIGLGWMVVLFERSGHKARTITLPHDLQYCDEDEECGIVNQIGCCPCEFGGTQGTVNRDNRMRLKAFLRQACSSGVACIDIASCRDDLRAVCKRHRCRLALPSEAKS